MIQKLLHLRFIPVKIILCPTHPATCTRPWRTSSKIAWAPYHSGSPLSAKRNRSAMSELHNVYNKLPKPKKIFFLKKNFSPSWTLCANENCSINTLLLLLLLLCVSWVLHTILFVFIYAMLSSFSYPCCCFYTLVYFSYPVHIVISYIRLVYYEW